jgi:hypothetical protein
MTFVSELSDTRHANGRLALSEDEAEIFHLNR